MHLLQTDHAKLVNFKTSVDAMLPLHKTDFCREDSYSFTCNFMKYPIIIQAMQS